MVEGIICQMIRFSASVLWWQICGIGVLCPPRKFLRRSGGTLFPLDLVLSDVIELLLLNHKTMQL
jgi:hypothetical protein